MKYQAEIALLCVTLILGILCSGCSKTKTTDSKGKNMENNVQSTEEQTDNTSSSLNSSLESSSTTFTAKSDIISQPQSNIQSQSTRSTIPNNITGALRGVSTSTNSPQKVTYKGRYLKYTQYRKSLQNTYTAAKKDKKLNIAYLGGSVTLGSGASSSNTTSWKAKTFDWIKLVFPEAKCNMIDVGIGESGSHLGSYIVSQHVIAQHPNLVFVEYAINDSYVMQDPYGNVNAQRVSMQVETIIRSIKSSLPRCDIVMLLTIDQGSASKYTWYYPAAAEHAKIAEAYNIPCIYIGRALSDYITQNKKNWNEYFQDIVHPNDKGYQIYFDVIKEYLQNSLFRSELKEVYSPADTLPKLVNQHLIDGDVKVVYASQRVASEMSGWTYDSGRLHSQLSTCGVVKAKITSSMQPFTARFYGTEFAMYTNLKCGKPIKYAYTIDGGTEKTGYFSSHTPTIIVSGLKAGEHIVRVKPVASTVTTFDEMMVSCYFTRDESRQTSR